MGIHAPNQEEYDAGSGFPDRKLLPNDEYIVNIKDYEVRPGQGTKYTKEGETPHDVQLWKLEPISFADGSELEDVDGGAVEEDRLLFAWIDPLRMGFSNTGPSKARKFFAAATGVMPTDNIDVEEYEDIFDKQIIVAVGKNDAGTQNKVNDYRAVRVERKRKREAKPVETEAAPEAAAALPTTDEELPF